VAAAAAGPAPGLSDRAAVGPGTTVDRLVFAVAAAGLLTSLALHVAVLAGALVMPRAPWSWLLHAGSVAGFWRAGMRLAAAGLTGVAGLLRVRRMVPIPVRLCLGAAALNTLVGTGLALAHRTSPGQALTAYWTMMYLLVTILLGVVVLRPGRA
jgi:hypothetical protein